MKDYSVLVGIKSDQRRIIDKAFDNGYEQGYKDGTKVNDGERGSIYYGGYADGYEKGLKDGIDRAWEAARTLISEVIKEDYVRNATPEESKSVNDYIKSISEETGVTFNEKEEQTTTSCRKCIHAHNMHDNILTCDAVPCVIKDGHCEKYEEKQETELSEEAVEEFFAEARNCGNPEKTEKK